MSANEKHGCHGGDGSTLPDPLAALRKLLELAEQSHWGGPDTQQILDDGRSALRLLGEGEPIAWQVRHCRVDSDYASAWHFHEGGDRPERVGRWRCEYRPLYTVPPAVVVPEGMALVPIEPTPDMCIAGGLSMSFQSHAAAETYADWAGACWAAMLNDCRNNPERTNG